MKQVTFECFNQGGLNRLVAIPLTSFLKIRKDYATNKDYLQLINESGIIDIYITQDSAGFDEESQYSNAGTSYLVNITGVTPKSGKVNQDIFFMLENNLDGWLVLFEDNNGYLRLAGNKESRLIFTRRDTTGNTLVSRNQVSFTFTGTINDRAAFIEDIAML
jgi:hypothetical protein